MSPEMTDFDLLPPSADGGTLRGNPFWGLSDRLTRSVGRGLAPAARRGDLWSPVQRGLPDLAARPV